MQSSNGPLLPRLSSPTPTPTGSVSPIPTDPGTTPTTLADTGYNLGGLTGLGILASLALLIIASRRKTHPQTD